MTDRWRFFNFTKWFKNYSLQSNKQSLNLFRYHSKSHPQHGRNSKCRRSEERGQVCLLVGFLPQKLGPLWRFLFQRFSVAEVIQTCTCFVTACLRSEQFFFLSLFSRFVIIIITCLSAEKISLELLVKLVMKTTPFWPKESNNFFSSFCDKSGEIFLELRIKLFYIDFFILI